VRQDVRIVVIFRSQNRSASKKFGKHWYRRFGTAWGYNLKVSQCAKGMPEDRTETLSTFVVTRLYILTPHKVKNLRRLHLHGSESIKSRKSQLSEHF